MTLHQIWVFYAGVMFCADALVLLGAWKVLGPAYKDRIEVGWKMRSAVFVLAIVCFIRGITLVFPGRSVHVQFVPWMVPAMATALFLVAALAAEWIVAQRAPPPVLHRLQAALAALAAPRHEDYAAASALMTSAGVSDVHVRFNGRRLRWLVISACALGLVILLALVLHAAAATLPR